MRSVMIRLVLLVSVGSLSACVSKPPGRFGPAARTRTAAVPPAPSTTPDEGIQCRTERVTGSLVGTRVCTTKAQREQRARSAQDMEDVLNRRAMGPCPGTPGCHN
jgi:predicted small lipoprotein YifL